MFKKIIVFSLLLIMLFTSNVFALTKEEVTPYVGKEVVITILVPGLFFVIPYSFDTVIGKIITEDGIDMAIIATLEGTKRISLVKILHITDGETEVGEIPQE